MTDKKLSTDPYKGVRDFYPEDQFLQREIATEMAHACELFGYEEYNASILEPAELYRSKTSDEIIKNQSYIFTDRGGREVMLRPEMTPTVARLIAARRRELALPVRWYSIQNFFRYEKPQKGRLREFWQLNADLLGVNSVEADAEVIALAHSVMMHLGADERMFEIRVSDRRLLSAAFDECGVDSDKRSLVTRLLDRRERMGDFPEKLAELVGDSAATKLTDHLARTTSTAYLEKLRVLLETMGVHNMLVDTSITRGFDYYTGMIFEVFDTSGENKRSMAGGGRYDNLLDLFGDERVPAVGFAMGDAVARDFMETHNLLPGYVPTTELMLCVVDESALAHAITLAQELRRDDVAVAVSLSGKKIGDQVRQADKLKIPYILAVGEKERISGEYTLKNLATGHELTTSADKIADHLFSSMG